MADQVQRVRNNDREDDEDQEPNQQDFLNGMQRLAINPVQVEQNAEHQNNAAQVQLDDVETPQGIRYCASEETIKEACASIKDLVQRKITANPRADVVIGFHPHEVTRVDNSDHNSPRNPQRIVKVELIALCVDDGIDGTCYLLHFTNRKIDLPKAFIEILANNRVIFVGGKKVVSQMQNVRIDWGILEECGQDPRPCHEYLTRNNHRYLQYTNPFEICVAYCLQRHFTCGGRPNPKTMLSDDLRIERPEGQGEPIRQRAQNYAATFVYLCREIYQTQITRG